MFAVVRSVVLRPRMLQRAFHASALSEKVISFNLPDIGEGIAEVEVLKWTVAEGDRVAQFDKVVEVQSDKANVDITSRYDGIVKKLHYKVGQMAQTSKPLMDIEVPDDSDAAAATPAAETPAASPASGAAAEQADEASNSASGVKALAAPAVRRIAKEHNVDITKLKGTGKDGRVTKEDILAFVEGKPVQPSKPTTPENRAQTTETATNTPVTAPYVPQVTVGGSYAVADQKMPVRGLGRAMVKSMTAAWAVPHFGYCDEVVMDGLMAARAQLKEVSQARGLRFSYLPFILKATSLALRSFPQLNAHVAQDVSEVTWKGAHNIGVAMDTPSGLIVPNVKNVQDKSLFDIAAELARLQALASSGKLGAADLSDGTFTLSNIGTIGGTYASPVLFMPQVAIGAIGKISKLPRYASTLPHTGKVKGDADVLVPAHIMTVSWAADHRVVDGATMARFSNAWKGYLENPNTMLAELR